jgi:hypothetical protein
VRRLARSRSSGRSLEVRGNSNPREMIIQAKRATSLLDRIRLIGLPLTLLLNAAWPVLSAIHVALY